MGNTDVRNYRVAGLRHFNQGRQLANVIHPKFPDCHLMIPVRL